jgi:membrane-bound acyltransferase YfiQ involved in biofilm formation
MTKRVFLLMGIAMLAVIVSHTAGFAQVALLEWRDRYRPATELSFDPFGSPQYYVLLCVRQLIVWAVPAFFFVSGFFVAYAAHGTRGAYTWKMAGRRVTDLLTPYLVWSGIWFVLDAFRGITFTPIEYLVKLVTGTADNYGAYFFVIVLVQLYLLSPLLVPVARVRPRLVLLASALLQAATLGLQYWVYFASRSPALIAIVRATSPSWLLFHWAFFFPLGLVCGLEGARFRRWLGRCSPVILPATIVLGLAAIVEPEAIYRLTGVDWRWSLYSISATCYSVGFILCFLAFDQAPIPFARAIQQIGRKSYPIYLIHMRAIHLVARLMYGFVPSLLAYQVTILSPILFASGLFIPLLIIASVAKSPARRYYRYVFG